MRTGVDVDRVRTAATVRPPQKRLATCTKLMVSLQQQASKGPVNKMQIEIMPSGHPATLHPNT
eukprot:m.353601 g.353601  ORF g.353601 m.353601 type:complete len:63 (-) comp16804_c0_seq1:183-371(-)